MTWILELGNLQPLVGTEEVHIDVFLARVLILLPSLSVMSANGQQLPSHCDRTRVAQRRLREHRPRATPLDEVGERDEKDVPRLPDLSTPVGAHQVPECGAGVRILVKGGLGCRSSATVRNSRSLKSRRDRAAGR